MGADHNPLNYYRQAGPFTDPAAYGPLLKNLPAGPASLVSTVQGLLIHIFWAERYGLSVPENRKNELEIRALRKKLERLLELDTQPLPTPRPLERKLLGNCRDFSIVLAAFLKYQGIPARARCGFATYFIPGHYEDHWTVQYWHSDLNRWVSVDGQIDAVQHQVLGLTFDPLDLPPGLFVTAGEAWQMCRNGKANPDDFGIQKWHGWDFIKWDVLRDVLALNRIEPLPWDFWGGMLRPVAEQTEAEMDFIDHLAFLTAAVDQHFSELLALYASDDRLHAPDYWV